MARSAVRTVPDAPATAPAGVSLPRHVLSSTDVIDLGMERLLTRAEALRRDRHAGRQAALLAGRQVALIFEKPSLRTRVSFEVGIDLLGGHAVYLGPDEVGLGSRETPADVGRNLSRWVDAIVVRTYGHGSVVELAKAASVPVINALTDREHPCQALADILTLRQHLGALRGRVLAFVGDGNNVCHSLILVAAAAGLQVRVATPAGYEPEAGIAAEASRLARLAGGSISTGHDPAQAVAGADAVYTDTWTSMGKESEVDTRRQHFAGFQVNTALLESAPDALVMHCQPAHRGEEITADTLDGPRSVTLDQAENRLYVQQALILELLDQPTA